jgi:hypothetical protein
MEKTVSNITVPGYPHRVAGRHAVAELYRPYGAITSTRSRSSMRSAGRLRPLVGSGRPLAVLGRVRDARSSSSGPAEQDDAGDERPEEEEQ